MNDTSPETASLVHARLMAETGAERFLMGVRMHEAARRMVMALFPVGMSPTWQRELLREKFYGADQLRRNPERRQDRPSRVAALHVSPHFYSMTITENVRKYAGKQAVSEEEALKKRMEAKPKEFLEKGSEANSEA